MSKKVGGNLSSETIYKTTKEIYAVWLALNEAHRKRHPNRKLPDYTEYMKKKYHSFLKNRQGTALFFHVKWCIENNQKVDLGRLRATLNYRDQINTDKISNEDASAHFEYAMHKKYAFNKYDPDHKRKIENEYHSRMRDKDQETKRNLFLENTNGNQEADSIEYAVRVVVDDERSSSPDLQGQGGAQNGTTNDDQPEPVDPCT